MEGTGDGSVEPEVSNSGTDGGSAVKKTKTQRRFTRVEKTILEERLENKQLNDRKGRSLKRKKDGEDKQSESNDKE